MKTTWTRMDYFRAKTAYQQDGKNLVLVTLTGEHIEDSVQASHDLYFGNHYEKGTTFVLYCGSGCPISGMSRDDLAQALPDYTFIDLVSGSGMYEFEKSNFEYEKTLG